MDRKHALAEPAHEQRIAAIREKAQRHIQRSAQVFAAQSELKNELLPLLPVPSLLTLACSAALVNQAQAVEVANEAQLEAALTGNDANVVLTNDIQLTQSQYPQNNTAHSINGQNHTVDANQRMFSWGQDKNINHIQDITFKNGSHTGSGANGGTFDLYGNGKITGTISNSHFIDSKADNVGGAIFTGAVDGDIKNSSFTGNTANLGGAIYSRGAIGGTIENSTFSNNSAKSGNGGAIHTVTMGDISGSTFSGNSTTGTYSDGGAIYARDSVLGDIRDTTFENNTAGGSGGGLITGTIDGSIIGTKFINNKSLNYYSGALHFQTVKGDIENSHFEGNSAKLEGGAIFGSTVTGTIRNSEFINNQSHTAHGGALYITGDLQGGIDGSLFQGNTAALNGGAIDIPKLSGGIRNSEFLDNRSINGDGGAVWVHQNNALNGISGSTFTNNRAKNTGGAISVVGTIENGIHNSHFNDNTSEASYGGAIGMGARSGGAGIINGGISGSTFKNNSAHLDGGAIRANQINGDISGTTFEKNTATGSGGAIWAVQLGIPSLDGSISDSKFLENSANDGGALRLGIVTGSIENTEFIGNSATNSAGGAIHGNHLNGGIKNSTFTRNTAAKSYGGAIFTDYIRGGISETTFTENKVTDGLGGAIHAHNEITGGITNSTFNNNSAGSDVTHNGGAISAGEAIKDGITGSTFEANQAGGSGGAISAQSYEGGIHDSKFINNSSGMHGGALDAVTFINGGIDSGSLFQGNSAAMHGGAIYAKEGINGTISNVKFEANQAVGGRGGALVTGILDGDIENSQFENNKAHENGGAFVADTITGTVRNSHFIKNQAETTYGGALYIYKDIAGGIEGSEFHENSSALNGGAIDSTSLSGGIRDSKFFDNQAHGASGTNSGSGGAVWVHGVNGVLGGISDSEFKDNSASTGGAIGVVNKIENGIHASHFENNQALDNVGGAIALGVANSHSNGNGILDGGIHNSEFINNSAKVYGGAIYAKQINGGINSSLFEKNTADDWGGAIWVNDEGNALAINNTDFLGNISHGSGGAIATPGTLTIRDSRFISNEATGQTTPSATGRASGVGGAVVVRGNLDIENSAFLGNQAWTRGAAIHHHHDESGTTQQVRIAGGGNQKTVFYGNLEKHSGRYSSIEFSPTRPNVVDVTIDASPVNGAARGHAGVVMFDPMQSSPQGHAGARVNIHKQGAGDWFLGGDNQMVHDGYWWIKQGALVLTDVDHGTGFNAAQIDLRDSNSRFVLDKDARLEGNGTIIAGHDIYLAGTISPNVWRSAAPDASGINTSISQNDIDGIHAAKISDSGKLNLVAPNVNMNGATYEVGVKWDDNGSGGIIAQSDRMLDITGALDIKNSHLNVTSLTFDGDQAMKAISSGGSVPGASIITTTGGISGDFDDIKISDTSASKADFLRVTGSNQGNEYHVNLDLAWYSKQLAPNGQIDANGDFTIDAGNSFTINGDFKDRSNGGSFQSSSGWDGNSLNKYGGGTLILNGDNSYTGLTTVDGGTLTLGDSQANNGARISGDVQVNNGAHLNGFGTTEGSVTVNDGASFSGTGNVNDHLHIRNGGLLAPGTDTTIGTVHAGSLEMDVGSTYRVKTNVNGDTDQVQVARDVTLHGGTVEVMAEKGVYWGRAGTTHPARTIIESSGGAVNGAFDDVSSNLAFLTPDLKYNGNQVLLEITRNATKLDALPDMSYNQGQTGSALADIEDSGISHPLVDELLNLSQDDARRAYDNLSGEIYPTTGTVLLQGSRQLRTRINTRLSSGTQGTMQTSSFNQLLSMGQGVGFSSREPQPVWFSAWGQSGNYGSSRNTAEVSTSGQGFLVGIDNAAKSLEDGAHAGLMLGSESYKVTAGDNRASRSEIDSRSVGLYGGAGGGDTQFRGGVIYSDLSVETQRDISVNNLTERLQSKQNGRQIQAFAEVSRNISLSERTSVAPWINVAQIQQKLDDVNEGSTAAALEVKGQSTSTTIASIGGRSQLNLSTSYTPVAMYVEAGYQHALNGQHESQHRFAGQAKEFAVRGVGLNDALLTGVGVQVGLSKNSALLVEYRGEFGSGQTQHVGNVNWQVRF